MGVAASSLYLNVSAFEETSMVQSIFQVLCAIALALASIAVVAAPAMLPRVETIPPREAQPIDGVWTVSSIGKRVRVEKGRVHVVDPWRHLFVMKVETGMVVVKDIYNLGSGLFSGYDLMALGPWRAVKTAAGTLDVDIGGLTPTRFQMVPVMLDYPEQFQALPIYQPTQSIPGGASVPAQSVPAEEPTSDATCRDVEYQPETDNYKCVR